MVCGGYGAAVAAAMSTLMELGSWQRQREAVAYGAVDALVSLLARARAEELAPAPLTGSGSSSSGGSGSNENDEEGTASRAASGSGGGDSDVVYVESNRSRDARLVRVATEMGLGALATLCARCEEARERTVGLGFHLAVRHWLAMAPPEKKGKGRGGGVDSNRSSPAVLRAALTLVRNLARSSVACSALVAVGTHESLFGMMTLVDDSDGGGEAPAGEDARGGKAGGDNTEAGNGNERNEGLKAAGHAPFGAAAAPAAGRVALASACLANMALEHEVVKEATVGSEDCLRSVCESALDLSANRRHVGSGCRRLLVLLILLLLIVLLAQLQVLLLPERWMFTVPEAVGGTCGGDM